MAYEYERGIIGMLRGIENRHLIDLSDHKQELKEAYAKAKAWDNYVSEVRERVKITVNTEDNIEKETQEIIDYYMEDK